MKPNYKKRLAKEILLFFAACALVLLCWGSLLLWNFYFENKVTNLNKELMLMQTKLDSLCNRKEEIKKIGFKTFLVNGETYDIPLSLITKFLVDKPNAEEAFCYKVNNNEVAIPISSSEKFLQKYPKAYRICFTDSTTKSKENDQLNSLNKQIKIHQKWKTEMENDISYSQTHILNTDSQKQFLFWLEIILLSLLYPARLIYLLIKWAIKTVKS